MAATILIATALFTQSPATAGEPATGVERVDVAYEELANRRPSAAIDRIRANEAIAADDPAALINLGAAYEMLGDKEKAAECYRAAIASDMRYDLQLADGSWMDSRRIARLAARSLAKGDRFAAR